MRAKSWMQTLILLAGSLAATSCANSENEVTLQGAGATFPAPLYKRWFLEYYKRNPDVRVNYQAIGSGAGIRQFEEGLILFGASDAFKAKLELKKGGEAFLLPMTAGSIVLCYNLPGMADNVRIKLSRDAYVRIFLGDITEWNDPDILKTNPGVKIPQLPVRVVRRADSSGTTFAFTNHLSTISPDRWKKGKGPGTGTSIEWPTGLAGRGNAGVAAIVQLTPGAIGYTEYSYAELAEIAMATLENKAGKFIIPSPESAGASLAAVKPESVPKNFHIDLPDPEGADSYPIVTCTWMLVLKKYDNPLVGIALKKVLKFCLTDGQAMAAELGFIPLPPHIVQAVLRKVEEIEVPGPAN